MRRRRETYGILGRPLSKIVRIPWWQSKRVRAIAWGAAMVLSAITFGVSLP